MKTKKIFIGIHETGNLTLMLSRGFRELGYEVTNVVIKPRREIKPKEGYDGYICLPDNMTQHWFDLTKHFLRNAFTHDIFIFNVSSSFYSNTWPLPYLSPLNEIELALLKSFGKKVVFIAPGSELRSIRLLIRDLKNDGLTSLARYFEKYILDENLSKNEYMKRKKARLIEKYGDFIFTRPNNAGLLEKPYKLLDLPFDVDTVEYNVSITDNPLVIHAPTNRLIKGTKYILNAVETLRREGYRFRFLLCENMPNNVLKKKLTEAEIVIDQLLLPGYALFAIEAMASGNVVLGNAIPNYNGFPGHTPVVTTNPGSIYNNLKMVLENPELRSRKAREGRRYVEKYHDYKKVAKNFLKKIEEL